MSPDQPTQSTRASGARLRWLGALGVFLLALLYFGPSVQRAIGKGDSAELVLASYTLGIPHPSGYPVYTWLGKLFSLVPVGGIPARVAFLSAVCAALVLAIVFHLVRRELERRDAGAAAWPAALLAAALLATTLPFQEMALIAELYTLKCLVVLVLLLLLGDYLETSRRSRLLAAAFVYGLSLSIHLANLFLLPFLLPFVWRPVLREPRTLLRCLLLFAAGLLPFLYVYFRAMAEPAYVHEQARFFELSSWTGSDSSLYNWIWFVTGGRWHGGNVDSLAAALDKGGLIAAEVWGEYGLTGAGLGLFGLLLCFGDRSRPRKGAGLIAAALATELFYYCTFRPSRAQMVLALFACLCVFAGLGIGLLPQAAARFSSSTRASSAIRAVFLVALCASGAALVVSKPRLDYAHEDAAAKHVARIIEELPEDCVLEGLNWHYERIALYYRIVEGRELPFRYAYEESQDFLEHLRRGTAFVAGSRWTKHYRLRGYRLEPVIEAEDLPNVYRVLLAYRARSSRGPSQRGQGCRSSSKTPRCSGQVQAQRISAMPGAPKPPV